MVWGWLFTALCAQGPAAVQCTIEHLDSKRNHSEELREMMWVMQRNPSASWDRGFLQNGGNFPEIKAPIWELSDPSWGSFPVSWVCSWTTHWRVGVLCVGKNQDCYLQGASGSWPGRKLLKERKRYFCVVSFSRAVIRGFSMCCLRALDKIQCVSIFNFL